MKSHKLSIVVAVGALLATLGSSAFAAHETSRPESATGVNQWQEFIHPQPGKTRAQVNEELRQAHVAGTLERAEYVTAVQGRPDSGRTKAQINGELRQSHDAGTHNIVLKSGDVYFGS